MGIQFQYGSKEHLSKTYKDANSSGMILSPTVPGAEAFLWAHGISGAGYELVDGSIDLKKPEVNIVDGSVAING